MLTLEQPGNYKFSLLHLGFRPFFAGAGLYAVVGMAIWVFVYMNYFRVSLGHIPVIAWHAHEMLYGYVMAVISGFLLTSVRNWTGIQTLRGGALLGLALLWLLARISSLTSFPHAISLTATIDISYNLLLILAIGYPLLKARQWKQMGILSKLLFLLAGNILFYGGLLGWIYHGVHLGLYTGLYIIVSLILMMARRVVPFFIEKRIGDEARIINRKWVDISSLLLMLVFLVVEVYWPHPQIAAVTALALFALHLSRLIGWYVPGIWREPMLWVLYLGYAWMVTAFLLRGLMLFLPIPPMLAVHAFAAGGIGMITLGMMARVSLGHTGREVYRYPLAVALAFGLVGIAAVLRVLLPLFFPVSSRAFILLAQAGWIAGFALFVFVYMPYWIRPRVDGRYG